MTTRIYFVRHAQPEYLWKDDRTRPLTREGTEDTKKVLEFLKRKNINVFYSSPYKRSIETIQSSADYFGKEIILDERLRERCSGENGNIRELFERRWREFDFHEIGGESLNETQKRMVSAIREILICNAEQNIVIGTHGTALSCVLNYYNNKFDFKEYWRIINWMPYVIELDFEGERLLKQKEHFYIEKIFKGTR